MLTDIFQPTHLLFVLIVALLVLGPKRLPEVARQLGSGLRDFRAAINGEQNDHRDEAGSFDSVYDSPRQGAHAESASTQTHEFAHSDSATTATETHQFAHGDAAPAATGTESSDTGHEPPATESGRTDSGSSHEFAHESTDSTANSSDTSA